MIRFVSAALVAATLLSALALGTVSAASPHAPSFAHRTYLRVPATQAARDWAWRQLGTRQWLCLDAIGHYESGWRVLAGNPDGSYGIPQANPGRRMASEGADWLTNPMTQVRWMVKYVNGPRYGSACKAWTFWQIHHWY